MKKIILAGIILAVGAYAVGYKSRDFVRDKIYLPIRSGIASSVDLKQYKSVECPKNALEIATFGQSNSTNHVQPLASMEIPKNLYQYDWKSKKCYHYKEPLLGVDGRRGNVITYTATMLANSTSKPVLIIPFGVGRTSVLQWAYGFLSFQQEFALDSIKKSGLKPQVFLWHQGESDVKSKTAPNPDYLKKIPSFEIPKDLGLGLTKQSYGNALQVVLDKTRQYFPESYFGIALVSRCSGSNQEWEPVREAQTEIVSKNKKTFISADSDKIYDEKTRHDRCHFSEQGAKELGKQYYLSLPKSLRQM
jgi:hypothetical protein